MKQALLLTLITIAPCAASAAQGVPSLAPQGSDSRRTITAARWDRLWTIGGNESDTLLLYPTKLAADSSMVYILDPGGPRVLALDIRTGKVRWSFGRRGHGPGEFMNPLSIAAYDGGVAVGDAATGRLTFIDRDGRLERSITLSAMTWLHSFCLLADGSILAVSPQVRGVLSRLSSTGHPLDYPSDPFTGSEAPDISHQLGVLAALRSHNGCVFAAQQRDGFALLDGSGSRYARHYIERFTPPPRRPPRQGDVPTPPDIDAIAVDVDSNTIAIAFGGGTTAAGRWIDFYDVQNGDYLRSVLTPRPPVNRMVWFTRVGEVYVVIHGIHQVPAISAFLLMIPSG